MEPSLLDRYAADGTMPVLGELVRSGRSLQTANRLDHLPDIVWPEIFTGRNGAELGWYRLPQQLFSGEARPREVHVDDFDLTGFWDHASRAGRVVASVDIPYSSASPGNRGLHVRGWGTHDKPFGTASDPDPAILEDLLARFGPYPVGHVHAEHTRCDDHDESADSYRALRDGLLLGADTKAKLVRHVLDEREWDLVACTFEEAHCGGHQLWHHAHPESPWHDPAAPEDVKGSLRALHQRLDAALGHVLEGAGDGTTVIVALSHGMQTTGGGWQLLGEWLVRLGYGSGSTAAGRARSRLPAPVKSAARTLLPGRARSSLQRVAGSLPEPLASAETRAVALMNSPCGAIRLNVVGRDPFGAIAEGREYDEVCAELEHELGELVETRSGRPAVARVTRSRQLYGERLHPNIPDLLVHFDPELAPIESVSSPRAGTIATPVRTPALPRSGDHTTSSRLICAGAGVRPAPLAPGGDIFDVAPTLLALLDVRVPASFAGAPLDLAAGPAPVGEPAA
jgi:predicted AlkP superfamily phosphohydrolase/phosphomutase